MQKLAQLYQKDEIKQAVLGKLKRYFGCDLAEATKSQLFSAVAMTVRDHIMEARAAGGKHTGRTLYYLSVEFLIGRMLHQNMLNLLRTAQYRAAIEELGLTFEDIIETEADPGLGNGGLGRLAACFLDSLASLNLPAMGCTIRYEYGLFRQKIVDGNQVELPDAWLDNGSTVWEVEVPRDQVEVRFGGRLEEDWSKGRLEVRHVDYHTVIAMPFDMPVIGYDTPMVDRLRMWSARSPQHIDMGAFSRGDYIRAVEEKATAEMISKVLYPEDNHPEGKRLRLQQHYFLSSASVQYIIRRFKRYHGEDMKKLPELVCLHVNDTHPGLAIPEMMRILLDEEGLGWEEAEQITRACFSYTNHTVMAEALEKWPEELLAPMLPRIYQILQELNRRQCAKLFDAFAGQWDRIGHLAILSYGHVNMANLCVHMSGCVNGVSQLHADILKKDTFHDFYLLEPKKFLGITNGITHRRWLMQANPALTALICESIGEGWRKAPERLLELLPFSQDAAFLDKLIHIKRENKVRLGAYLKSHQDTVLDPDSLIDVQAKRLHEYKRQLLNILHVLYLYNRIVEDPSFDMPPQTFVFAAKASPGYHRAKLIIRLINAVAELVKRHPRASGMLHVVFVENYGVSIAEILIPAADVSEQLSTAGKEASGTGNMKFMMNGALTIGTMDGANVEIAQQVGRDNIYIFGLSANEVEALYRHGYRAGDIYQQNGRVRHLLEQLIDGTLSGEPTQRFGDLYRSLLFGDGGIADPYLVLKDFDAYAQAQEKLRRDATDERDWARRAAINIAKSGIFSSDRTITEYNELIWHLPKLTF